MQPMEGKKRKDPVFKALRYTRFMLADDFTTVRVLTECNVVWLLGGGRISEQVAPVGAGGH